MELTTCPNRSHLRNDQKLLSFAQANAREVNMKLASTGVTLPVVSINKSG